jgi:hypothetical protein
MTFEDSMTVEGTLHWSKLLGLQKRNADFAEDVRMKHTYNLMFKHKQGA